MTNIWVYEYRYPKDNDFFIKLFADKDKAQQYAIGKITDCLMSVFAADLPKSKYNSSYNSFIELASSDHLKDTAIRYYNSWLETMELDKQFYHYVYIKNIIGEISSSERKINPVHFDNGADCKKCKQHNEYVSESNQDDGTYLCGSCKALGSVFG